MLAWIVEHRTKRLREEHAAFRECASGTRKKRGRKRPVCVLRVRVAPGRKNHGIPACAVFGRITLKRRPKRAKPGDAKIGDRVRIEVPIHVVVPRKRKRKSAPKTRKKPVRKRSTRAARKAPKKPPTRPRSASVKKRAKRPPRMSAPPPDVFTPKSAPPSDDVFLPKSAPPPDDVFTAKSIPAATWGTRGALMQLRRATTTRTAKGCLAARVEVTPDSGAPFAAWLTVAHNAYDGNPPAKPNLIREIRARLSSTETRRLGDPVVGTAWCDDIYDSDYRMDAALIHESEPNSTSGEWIASKVADVLARDRVSNQHDYRYVAQNGAVKQVTFYRWADAGDIGLKLNGSNTPTFYPECMLLRGWCEGGDSGTIVYRETADAIQAVGILCGRVKIDGGKQCIVAVNYNDARDAILAGGAIRDFVLRPLVEITS